MGSAQLYHIGDLYTAEDGSQGIVFFVQADGSGWAVALHDLPTNLPWSPSHLNVPGLNDIGDPFAPVASTNDFSGYANTQQIRSMFGISPNYAAGAVDFNFGWYLPSVYQLCILYAQLPFIETALLYAGGSSLVSASNSTASGYWSSSEVSTDQAWVVFFNPSLSSVVGSGAPQSFTKASPQGQRVRAVHDIPAPNNVYDSTLTYVWNTGSTEPHFFDVPLQTTNYTVTVNNTYGCSNSASVAVIVIDNELQIFYDTICQGATYNNFGFTLTSEETRNILDTTLTRTISAAGCEGEITLYLTLRAPDVVEIEKHAEDSLVWNGTTYTEDGVYPQYFNNQYGCDSTVILILTLNGNVDPDPEPDPNPDTTATSEAEQILYLPNAFTPNHNGKNEVFLPIFSNPDDIQEYSMDIYNRWGALVFHTEEITFGWDGANAMDGVYVVVVHYKARSGKPKMAKRSVTLVR